jgi:hypothetical protein
VVGGVALAILSFATTTTNTPSKRVGPFSFSKKPTKLSHTR